MAKLRAGNLGMHFLFQLIFILEIRGSCWDRNWDKNIFSSYLPHYFKLFNKLFILDNGQIHKKEETKKIIKDSGNFLLYTIPLSSTS